MKKSGDEDFEKGRKKTPVDSTGVLMSMCAQHGRNLKG